MKLFMLLLGCTPPGRRTEQHDIFFGISETIKDLVPHVIKSWPNAVEIHIDAWREVNAVDGFQIQVVSKQSSTANMENKKTKLFFINLGGYRQNEFDEFHYKMLIACENKTIAIKQAKASAFYKHTGFKEAPSHIDDKYGVDVDDIYEIDDILAEDVKENYSIQILPSEKLKEDELHLGYFRLEKL